MTAHLCPALLGYLGRHARGMLWRLAGQPRAAENGLYESPPYETGDGPPSPWGGFPPLPCSPEHGLAYLVGSLLRAAGVKP